MNERNAIYYRRMAIVSTVLYTLALMGRAEGWLEVAVACLWILASAYVIQLALKDRQRRKQAERALWR